MKPRLLQLLLVLLVIVASLAALVVIYLGHPLFGALPEGKRLQRLAESANFQDGIFRNQIESPLHTAGSSELSILKDNLFGEKGQPRPDRIIPAVKTDLKALDPAIDLVVWLGHSSYYVQIHGQRLLIDPVFSDNAAPIPRANQAFEGTNLYSADDMPELDAVLITHDHYDHLDYPTITALRPKVRQVITGLGVGAHFEAWGYPTTRVHEADWYDRVELVDGLTVHITPSRHFSGRTLDRNRSLWVGFALLSDSRRIFFSGDSGYGHHFAEAGERFGPFDWVTLDSGQYDPRWANVHMNPEQAAKAAEDLKARTFTPGHVGKFSIAPHDWNDPFIRIANASLGRGYELRTPVIGQPLFLDERSQSFTRWWEHQNENKSVASGGS